MTHENKQPPSFVEAVEARARIIRQSSGIRPFAAWSQALTEVLAEAGPVALKTHGAWDGLEALDDLPDNCALFTAPQPDLSAELAEAQGQFEHLDKANLQLLQACEEYTRTIDRLTSQLATAQAALTNSGNRHEYTAPPGMVFIPESSFDELKRYREAATDQSAKGE
jgi:hypothetical protein